MRHHLPLSSGTHLLSTGFGAEVSEYHSRVGECWLISMVARGMKPGCKVDTLPVFEGEQGTGKSSGLRILGGELFTECHEQITSKDFYSVLAGRWLVEISEMHSFSKAEVERIKGIISNQKDRYRLPYDKHASAFSLEPQIAMTGTTTIPEGDVSGRWPVGSSIKTGSEKIEISCSQRPWYGIRTAKAGGKCQRTNIVKKSTLGGRKIRGRRT